MPIRPGNTGKQGMMMPCYSRCYWGSTEITTTTRGQRRGEVNYLTICDEARYHVYRNTDVVRVLDKVARYSGDIIVYGEAARTFGNWPKEDE